MVERTATLIINLSDTKCSHCGHGALLSELSHQTIVGYSGTREGCGAVYTAITSFYINKYIEEAAIELRPDLPWKGLSWKDLHGEDTSSE